METKIVKILDMFNQFSDCDLYEKGYISSPQHFIRQRKLSFSGIIHILLNLPKRKLGLELDDYFEYTGNEYFTVSAFSQARYKVKHKYFIDLNQDFIENIYREMDKGLKTWRGHRVISWDGTTSWVLLDNACRQEFGGSKNQYGTKPLGRALYCYDILNGFLLESHLFSYHQSEYGEVKAYLGNHKANDIAIYDIGFMSFEMLYLHEIKGLKFVIRSKLTFNTEVIQFVASSKRSQILRLKIRDIAAEHLLKEGYAVDKDKRYV